MHTGEETNTQLIKKHTHGLITPCKSPWDVTQYNNTSNPTCGGLPAWNTTYHTVVLGDGIARHNSCNNYDNCDIRVSMFRQHLRNSTSLTSKYTFKFLARNTRFLTLSGDNRARSLLINNQLYWISVHHRHPLHTCAIRAYKKWCRRLDG